MTPLMLIHGWAGSPHVWQPLAAHGLHVGAHPVFRDVTTVDGFGVAVERALPPAPGIVIGWSLGALLAIQLAHRCPARVHGLILIGGTLRFVDEHRRYGWPKGAIDALARRLERDPVKALTHFRRQFFSPTEAAAVAPFLQMFPGTDCGDFTVASLQAGLHFLENTDLTDIAGQIKCPVLWIHGAADAVCPIAGLDLIPAEHQTYSIPGAGHAPFWTRPDATLKPINEFLQNHGCHD